MNSKKIKKFITTITICLFFLVPEIIFAAPNFSINPSSGYVAKDKEFTIDILIDSDLEELVKARFVITFDPEKVKILKAKRNNGLFETYPSTEQTTDNSNGVVMLTGFTQSGSGTLYKTATSPDIFARLTFLALKEGEVKFEWEYSGEDVPFKTIMLKDGSPPQNVMISKPSSVKFTIQNAGNAQQPKTGIFEDAGFIPGIIGIIGGVMLFAGSSLVIEFTRKYRTKKYRTMVEYDDE